MLVINQSLGVKDKINSRFLLKMMETYFLRNSMAHHPPPRATFHYSAAKKTVNWEKIRWLCKDQKHAWKRLHSEGNMSKEDLDLAEKLATLWFNCHARSFSGNVAIPTKFGLKVQTEAEKLHNTDETSDEGKNATPLQEGKKVKKSKTPPKPERPFEWPYRQGQWDEVLPRDIRRKRAQTASLFTCSRENAIYGLCIVGYQQRSRLDCWEAGLGLVISLRAMPENPGGWQSRI